MSRNLKLLIVVILEIGGVSCGCDRDNTVHSAGAKDLRRLFDGFVYVGVNVNKDRHDSCGVRALPASFEAGHEYTFHHRMPFEGLDFANVTVPAELKALGFTVTKDAASGNFAVLELGGTIWGLRFSKGACSGLVFSQRCRSLTRWGRPDPLWGEQDFVLELHGNCAAAAGP